MRGFILDFSKAIQFIYLSNQRNYYIKVSSYTKTRTEKIDRNVNRGAAQEDRLLEGIFPY